MSEAAVVFKIGERATCVIGPSESGLHKGSVYTVKSIWNTHVELVEMPGVLHAPTCFVRSKSAHEERGVAMADNTCAKCSAPLPCKYHEDAGSA
jgi:hypothetical protein